MIARDRLTTVFPVVSETFPDHGEADLINKALFCAAVVILSSVVSGPRCVIAGDPVLIAHRGMLRHAPENTLPAFAVCLELGMGFELDIRTTKDGHLIVIHDDSVERTTDGPACSIRELTLKQVKQLDAGRWFDPVFTGVRIPTLKETFELIKQRKRGPTIIALNIKQVNKAGEAELVSLVEKYNLIDETFAFDQNVELSKRLKKLNPNFRIGQNVSRKNLKGRIQENLLDSFLLTFAPTPEEVKLLHRHGKQVIYNFAGSGEFRRNPKVWLQVREAQIDGMLTDYPLECKGVWRKSDKLQRKQ